LPRSGRAIGIHGLILPAQQKGRPQLRWKSGPLKKVNLITRQDFNPAGFTTSHLFPPNNTINLLAPNFHTPFPYFHTIQKATQFKKTHRKNNILSLFSSARRGFFNHASWRLSCRAAPKTVLKQVRFFTKNRPEAMVAPNKN
jgi:hypothetical protein